MGANQSQITLPNEKLVIERLRELQLEDQADEYVQVDEKALSVSKNHFRAPWTSLSTTEVASWEHQLLQDPKNRYVVSPLLVYQNANNVTTDSHSPPCHPQIQRAFLHLVQRQSKIHKSSASRSHSKGHPSQTSDLQEDVGSLPLPTSSELHS